MNRIYKIISEIRKRKPLVHAITNSVTIADAAQILKNIGALPVMAYSPAESREITEKSDALLVNTGTLTKDRMRAIIRSVTSANKHKVPVTLDIVGYSSSRMRTEFIDRLLKKKKISVLKGNMGELSMLLLKRGGVRGVESSAFDKNIFPAAKGFAKRTNIVVVITGETDFVTDGDKSVEINGSPSIMKDIVGTGCMLGALISAASSVEKDIFQAALSAVVFYKNAASEVFKKNKKNTPSLFKINFIDAFYNTAKIEKGIKNIKIKYL
jgi:hydroxyethylthiazole kinase